MDPNVHPSTHPSIHHGSVSGSTVNQIVEVAERGSIRIRGWYLPWSYLPPILPSSSFSLTRGTETTFPFLDDWDGSHFSFPRFFHWTDGGAIINNKLYKEKGRYICRKVVMRSMKIWRWERERQCSSVHMNTTVLRCWWNGQMLMRVFRLGEETTNKCSRLPHRI